MTANCQGRNNWFAGLDAANHPPPHQDPSSDAPVLYGPQRSPSPVHGGYARWLTEDYPSSTRDAAAPAPHRPNATSSSRPANAPTSAPHRTPQPPPPRPQAPAHSNNWLDPAEARRPARVPYIPEPFATLEPQSSSGSSVSTSDTDPENDPAFEIDDLITDGEGGDEDSAMPPTTRRSHRNSVVDLTNDPSSPPRPTTSTHKRSRDDPTQDRWSKKRSRQADSVKGEVVEELDLTNEAPSAEEELLQTQQQAAIAAQQAAATSDQPLRVGQRTCIICMEPYTNATITACGHIYCHECLTQALIAGEKNSERGVGNCPVCRKPVSRKKDRQMVPVSFMKRETFKGKRRVGVV